MLQPELVQGEAEALVEDAVRSRRDLGRGQGRGITRPAINTKDRGTTWLPPRTVRPPPRFFDRGSSVRPGCGARARL